MKFRIAWVALAAGMIAGLLYSLLVPIRTVDL
jgi:xanthosine utilization system XapX-like protein